MSSPIPDFGNSQILIREVPEVSFSWYDYVFFCVMLALSAIIGIYFGCFGTKQSSESEYLLGNKKMKVIPISLSLIASHISGVTLLAVPADVYRYGAIYWLFAPALIVVTFLTIHVYLPVFYKLQITSIYEYLGRRFDNTNRMFASFLYALGLLLYLPIVIYIPALALSAATEINVHYITPVVCGICIFYTTLGGLKAVVWTDTLQFTITIGAVLTVFGIGVKSAGGIGPIWEKAIQGHRLDIFDFNPDPTKRDSFWIVLIGTGIFWLSLSAINQSCVQKYLSVPTYQEAQLCVIFLTAGIIIVSSLSIFIGLMMYARYADCDPFTTGAVEKNDQLLPYFIMDVASHIPGLSGLFIAGIFCAALSTLSACLNCVAGTLYEDFVSKFVGDVQEKTAAYILKILVVVTGLLCMSLVYLIEHLGGILPLAIGLGGITTGPLLGLFTLGLLFPRASSRGSFWGTLISLVFTGWIVVMAQYYNAEGAFTDIPKPTSIAGCVFNETNPFLNFTETVTEQTFGNTENQPFALFRISYYYYAPLGSIVTIVCGLVLSFVLRNTDPPVHRDLLSPAIHFLLSDKENKEENNRKNSSTVYKTLELISSYERIENHKETEA